MLRYFHLDVFVQISFQFKMYFICLPISDSNQCDQILQNFATRANFQVIGKLLRVYLVFGKIIEPTLTFFSWILGKFDLL